ncbi:MAG: hypothetical protein AAF602_17670 [Myxococcota bacterium]
MWLWIVLAGCRLPDLNDGDGDGVDHQRDCDDTAPAIGERCPARCAIGWGPILEEAPNADLAVPNAEDVAVLHVWSGADPEIGRRANDGRARQPFADLGAALQRAQEIGGPVVVAVSAGTYPVNASLYRESDTVAQGPRIVGCGPDEVIIESGRPDRPVLDVRSQDLDPFDGIPATWSVKLRGVTVRGGRRAIRAVGSVDLAMQDVRVEGAGYYAVQGYGRQVRLGLTDVTVSGSIAYTAPFPGSLDLGVGVGALRGAIVEAERLTVDTAVGVGIVLAGDTRDGAKQRLDEVVVRDVSPTAGRLGRGVLADGLMDLEITALRVERVRDAAIWVRNAGAATLSNLVIDDVQPASPPDGPADGVVLLQDAFDIVPSPFAYRVDTLTAVTDPERAAVVASGAVRVSAIDIDGQVIEEGLAEVSGEIPDPAPPLFELDLEALPDDPPN